MHNSGALFLVPSLELFSFCLFVSFSNVLVFALLYCILLLSLRSLLFFFLTKDRERMDLVGRGGREDLEGIEGGEPLMSMYYVRKISIFNKRINIFLDHKILH